MRRARLPLLGAPLGAADLLRNLVPVIAGNIIGASVRVALVYWLIYLRPGTAPPSRPE